MLLALFALALERITKMHKQNNHNYLRLLIKKTVAETIKEAAGEILTPPETVFQFVQMISDAAKKAGASADFADWLTDDPNENLAEAWSTYEREIRGLNKKEMWNTFLDWAEEGVREAGYAYVEYASKVDKRFDPENLATRVVQVLNNQKVKGSLSRLSGDVVIEDIVNSFVKNAKEALGFKLQKQIEDAEMARVKITVPTNKNVRSAMKTVSELIMNVLSELKCTNIRQARGDTGLLVASSEAINISAESRSDVVKQIDIDIDFEPTKMGQKRKPNQDNVIMVWIGLHLVR